ncbi:MAG: (d)CMP kinase [Cyclobacteriaceae bacterium]|nr:(d)CMP kinase [Cyclobacteriaceae bacterium]
MKPKEQITIAIDGHSACGKSTTAKAVAKKMGFTYIDSGAMYRAVTLQMIRNQIDLNNLSDVEDILQQTDITFRYNSVNQENEIYLNGINVENEIRSTYVANLVSDVSALLPVRKAMVRLQQKIARTSEKGVVMDGRDIGTVVLPDADFKFFMTADAKVRAARRQKELEEKGVYISIEDVLKNLSDRDKKDSSRKESPLRKADDAINIDTSNLTFEDQVNIIIKAIAEK